MSDTALSSGEAAPRVEGAVPALRARLRVEAGQARTAVRVVYAGTAAYAALFVFAAVLHYVVFQTPNEDLGSMAQAIWNTLHGHVLETTTLTGHQVDRLGYHVDPFLLLLAPLLWMWSNPVLLPVVQALAVASGALPVFWLARKHLGSPRAGAHFALAYLLYPATQFNAFTVAASFHPLSMAVPLLLYAVWFLDEDRPIAFLLMAVLACTTNEEIPLAVGCLGIWYAVRKGRRLFGVTVFLVGFAVTLFDFTWVIPHFAPHGVDPFAHRYRAVGETPAGMAHKIVTDPMAFVHAVANGHKATFLALLLLPFLGLCLLEPLLLLGAVPGLVVNLLSSWGNQTSISYEDTAAIVPFVVAAAIFGAARLKGQADRLSLWALVGAALVAVYSPIVSVPYDFQALGSPLVAAKAQALDLVPEGVPVSSSNQLGAHLSDRRYSYTFPIVDRSRWIVVDVNDPTEGDAKVLRPAIRTYEADKTWRIIFSSHGIVVLHQMSERGRPR